MTARTCIPCDQPVIDRWLCKGCEIRLRNNLTELVDLNGELHTAMCGQVRMADHIGGRSAETPLAYAPMAAEMIRLIRSTLVSWVRELHNDTGTPLPNQATIAACVDWLLPLIPEIATFREDSAMLYDEVKHLRDQAQKLIDHPQNRAASEIGPCPEDVDGEPCPGRVWKIVPRDETQRPRLECRDCRTVWYGEQFLRAGRRILARQSQHDERMSA